MSEPFIGEIRMVGFNFAPRGWTLCDGQMLPISQNIALFSLLGITYVGDDRTTFYLPDLRGRAAIHQGPGPRLTTRPIGQKGGAERITSPRILCPFTAIRPRVKLKPPPMPPEPRSLRERSSSWSLAAAYTGTRKPDRFGHPVGQRHCG